MFSLWSAYFPEKAAAYTRRIVRLALDEDGTEMTGRGIFTPSDIMHAKIRAKERTHVAGLPIIPIIFQEMGADAHIDYLCDDGVSIAEGTEVVHIDAPAAVLLKAERIILNFVSHLSGIANLTAVYVAELHDTGVTLLDTRKTTPGMRWLEKYAVRLVGGGNHRRDLEEMLMLKDNHIDQAGSIAEAVAALRKKYAVCPPIEVECRCADHVREALAAGVERVMMDNMRGKELADALALVPADVEAEVSGGVTLDNIREIAMTAPRRPDFISVGRLTHSAVSADFSMTLQQTR